MDEVWKSIPGFSGYEVSNQGQIKSHRGKKPRILRAGIVNGYNFVNLRIGGKSVVRRVAHLVLFAFFGPRPIGLVVCHNNSIKNDDRLENLRYDTQKANLQDARIYNGGVSPNASLTLKEAEEVFIYCKSHTISETARKFGIKEQIVRNVIGKCNYTYIGFLSKRKQKIGEAEQIREMYATNKYTYAKLGKKFNLSISTICRIVKRQIRIDNGVYL